jgi:heme/copper-type cytochrome/quinol oxidase subunit 2
MKRTPKQKRFDHIVATVWFVVVLPAFLIFVWKYAGAEGAAQDRARWDQRAQQ